MGGGGTLHFLPFESTSPSDFQPRQRNFQRQGLCPQIEARFESNRCRFFDLRAFGDVEGVEGESITFLNWIHSEEV